MESMTVGLTGQMKVEWMAGQLDVQMAAEKDGYLVDL